MKKLALILLIFSLFTVFSSAEIVKNGETLDSPIGELSVNLYYADDRFTSSIRSAEFRAVLDQGECEIFNLYNICVETIEEVDDFELGEIVLQADIKVEELTPTIERTAEKTEVKEGDDIVVTVKLTNPGNRMDVRYVDTWPKEFMVIQTGDNVKYYVLANRVVFERQLSGEEIFQYKVRLLEPVDKEISATLEYASKKITSSPLHIKSTNSLGIDSSPNPSKPKLYQKANLTVSVENKGDSESIDLSFLKITFPPGIEIIGYDDSLTKKGATFEISEEELKDELEFSFDIKPTQLGLHKIIINAEAVEDGKTIKSVGEEEIDLEIDELSISLKIVSEIYKANDISLRATIENDNEDVTFNEINCDMSGLFSKQYNFDRILPKKALDIEDVKINLDDTSTRKVTQALKCDYVTHTGQKMSTTKNKEIFINISSENEEFPEDEQQEDIEAENEEEIIDNNEEDSSNVIIEDKKPGFFTRIVNFFKKIFSKEPAFEREE